jgi:hypothetical protein
MRRVLWRDCDSSKEMRIYVTTTVNFGDRPAGCIAIAALRETAERYGADLPIAAWYLKYRTYVDDAVAGSDTREGMVKLSSDLEVLAGRGGFQFKGTLMTGDAAANPSEPRKVLGLIWETLEDKLQADVKLNTGSKIGGARVQDDIDWREISARPCREPSPRGSCGEWPKDCTTRWDCSAPSLSDSRS